MIGVEFLVSVARSWGNCSLFMIYEPHSICYYIESLLFVSFDWLFL